EGQAGAVGAKLLTGLGWADLLAHQREHERLRDAHDRELVVGISDRGNLATGSNHADPKQLARNSRQSGVDLRVLTFRMRLKTFVRFTHQSGNEFVRRQSSRRDVRLPGYGIRLEKRRHCVLSCPERCKGSTRTDRCTSGKALIDEQENHLDIS